MKSLIACRVMDLFTRLKVNAQLRLLPTCHFLIDHFSGKALEPMVLPTVYWLFVTSGCNLCH